MAKGIDWYTEKCDLADKQAKKVCQELLDTKSQFQIDLSNALMEAREAGAQDAFNFIKRVQDKYDFKGPEVMSFMEMLADEFDRTFTD